VLYIVHPAFLSLPCAAFNDAQLCGTAEKVVAHAGPAAVVALLTRASTVLSESSTRIRGKVERGWRQTVIHLVNLYTRIDRISGLSRCMVHDREEEEEARSIDMCHGFAASGVRVRDDLPVVEHLP